MKIEKRWIISFIIISIVCIIGAFWPTVTENAYVLSKFDTLEHIVPADVAWMLTGSIAVAVADATAGCLITSCLKASIFSGLAKLPSRVR